MLVIILDTMAVVKLIWFGRFVTIKYYRPQALRFKSFKIHSILKWIRQGCHQPGKPTIVRKFKICEKIRKKSGNFLSSQGILKVLTKISGNVQWICYYLKNNLKFNKQKLVVFVNRVLSRLVLPNIYFIYTSVVKFFKL